MKNSPNFLLHFKFCYLKVTREQNSNNFTTHGSLGSSSLKTWTVSVLDEQHKNVASWLKAKLQMDTHRFTPLLNSWSRVPSATLNTRITVPFSEAVAILAPDWLKLSAAKGLSWAAIIVLACYGEENKPFETFTFVLIKVLRSSWYLPNYQHQISAPLP